MTTTNDELLPYLHVQDDDQEASYKERPKNLTRTHKDCELIDHERRLLHEEEMMQRY